MLLNFKISKLKKLFVILSVFLIINSTGFSQEEEYKPFFAFGIKQGISYSSVNFSPGIRQGLTLGYQGGLVYRYQNEKLFALQVEVNFVQKGWTEDLDTIDNSYSRKLNYVELPFITQVVMGKKTNLKYYVNLGTSFAYFLSEKEDLEVNNELYRREYYEKPVENYFDFGALAELGLMYNTNIGEFQIGVRYQLTLTDLFKSTTETVFDNSQNQFWNLSLTYFFLDNR